MAGPALAELLVQKGVRPTRQRLRVLEELAGERDDATAQILWRRLCAADERIGLATVYRTLALLHEHGVVDSLSHHGTERCYRLCAAGHHHHLYCERCHRVVEIDECTLEGWVAEVAGRHGFVASEHRVEINGLCTDCRSARSDDP
jgi:Fur family transcriptional regulator, ferric uptake regulator